MDNANGGGGKLIYPNVRHWADAGPGGRKLAQDIMVGYAHRMPIFRWGRDAFEQGRIEPVGLLGKVIGDRTTDFSLKGYGGEYPAMWPKVGGTHDALDWSHRGRLTGVTAELARQGDPMAAIILDAIADDAHDCFTTDTGVDGRKEANTYRWDAHTVLKYHPKGKPYIWGRKLGHALYALAAACQYGDRERHLPNLRTLVDVVNHCWDHEYNTCYELNATDPEYGTILGQARFFGSEIPEGKWPALVKTFELGIIHFGLLAAAKVLGEPWIAARASHLHSAYKAHQNQVWCPGTPEYDSKDKGFWLDTILGTISIEDLSQMALTQSPIEGRAASYPFAWELIR